MIGTVFLNQGELLDGVMRLHVPAGIFDLDATFGPGGMHKGVKRAKEVADLSPKSPDVKQEDCTATGREPDSLTSILFDPPFLAGGGKTTSVMHKHYSSFPTVVALYDFYDSALKEFARVLAPAGVLVFKCQDINNGRSQGFSHCEIYNSALQLGLYALDLFVLENTHRMTSSRQKNQFHARKTHCYFWVFKKCDRKNYRKATS